MDIINLLISLASGALGGNLAAKVLKDFNLGTLGNSICGILGGGIGGGILQSLGIFAKSGGAASSSGIDLGALLGSVAGGCVGGGVLLLVVGFIKKAMGNKK